MKNKIALLFFLTLSSLVVGQELNCLISINSAQIPGSNKQIFTTLKNSLNEFVNQTKWTGKTFNSYEKINCSMNLTLSSREGDTFSGEIQVQSSRPSYNSTYQTTLLNFKDADLTFDFKEFETLVFNKNTYESNLTSALAFYVYMMLGLDADSFENQGGSSYYAEALNIASVAQQGGKKGWSRIDGTRTRYALVDELLSPSNIAFRNLFYKYHLQGIDRMEATPKEGKETIAGLLLTLRSYHRTYPDSFLLRTFMDSKSSEISSIFSGGPSYSNALKLRATLLEISPINASSWNAMK